MSTISNIKSQKLESPSYQTLQNPDPREWIKGMILEVVDAAIAKSQEHQEHVRKLGNAFSYQYGEKLDPFHVEITRLVRTVLMFQVAGGTKKEMEDLFITSGTTFTACQIIHRLLNFKEAFPQLFEKRKYAKDISFIQDLANQNEVELPSSYSKKIDESYQIIRPLNEFKGDQLVIGCGRNISKLGGCGGHDENKTLFLNIDPESGADILANYPSHEVWKVIPDQIFKEVFFEGFVSEPHQFSLKEICRTLKDGGKVRLPINTTFTIVSQEDKNYLDSYFKSCGFQRVEIANETFKSCGSEDEHVMVIAYK